jgi:hypothetical protein
MESCAHNGLVAASCPKPVSATFGVPHHVLQRQVHLRETVMKRLLVLICLLLLHTQSAMALPPTDVSNVELVLREDTRLEVTAPAGKLVIVAGKGLARQYQWDDCVVDAHMTPRSSRWLGSLGMYDPVGGRRAEPRLYPSCPEQIHMPVGEGQMHFPNVQSAEEWIRHFDLKPSTTIWTNDGVLVRYNASRGNVHGEALRGLGVDLMLICVNGQRPTKLTGATDRAIRVSHSQGSSQGIQACVKVSNDVIVQTQKVLHDNWTEREAQAVKERLKIERLKIK